MADTLSSALKQISTPQEGERLIYAAVIYTAKMDATTGDKSEAASLREIHRRSALTYFQGPVYQHHCEMLGMAPMLPPEVNRILEKEETTPLVAPDSPQEVFVTRSMDEIFTKEMCLSLHKQYLEKDLAITDLFVERRKGKSVSSATISKYFRQYGLPTRPQGGWTPEAHAAALAVHGLTAQDVEDKVATYMRPCAVCGKEITRYLPFSGDPEYTHCGSSGCVTEVRAQRKRDKEIGEEKDYSKDADPMASELPLTTLSTISITKRNGETIVIPAPQTEAVETAVSYTNDTAGLAKIDSLRDLVTELEAHGAKVQVSGKLIVELEF